MDFKELSNRALEVRKLYSDLEKRNYGREWTKEETFQAFVGDVGDLGKLVMAKEGVRDIKDADEKISHELSDCLWSVLVLANRYDVDLEKSFNETMDQLEEKIKNS